MRVALISDLHSHLVALEAVLDDISAAGLDRIVCLGDIVDMGPRPLEVVHKLQELRISSIEGNHDPLTEKPPVPMLAAIESWTADQLDVDARAFLAGLPASLRIDLDGFDLLCVHGSPRSYNEPIVAFNTEVELDEMFADCSFDVLVCGHTHVQLLRRRGAQVVVNVGSTSMPFVRPFDGEPPMVYPWAEYAIVEATGGRVQVQLRQVAYDMDRYKASVVDSGMPYGHSWLSQWLC